MQHHLFGLSFGFATLILLTAHVGGANVSLQWPLPTEAAATLPEAPR